MLKNRLIPVLFLKNGYLVRSEEFCYHQNLGNPVAQVERYNSWDVDELIYIDISNSKTYGNGRIDSKIMTPNSIIETIEMVASRCFMPLTFGGGIRTLNDIRERLKFGADKVTINTVALENPVFITQAAEEFGSQAIIVSIDARHDGNEHKVYSHRGSIEVNRNPWDWAREAEERGAGEIFVNSIDRDGTAKGYDLTLIRKTVRSTTIPVIACGGVGDTQHFVSGIIEGEASAVAAGNIFNFKEMSYILAKRELKKLKLNFR
jgi:cyclase